MPSVTPFARHAAIMRSHSVRLIAIGFSHRTCLPASAAAVVCSACRYTGVATYTPSRSGSRTRSCHREYGRTTTEDVEASLACDSPNERANSSASSARARAIASSSHAGESRIAGATRLRAISPAPIKPQLNTILKFGIRNSEFGIEKNSEFRMLADPNAFRIPNSEFRITSDSEFHLEGDLHLALGRSARGARRAGEHRRDGAERRVAERRVRVRELRVVQDIEHFNAHFGIDVGNLRVLDHRQVDVEIARP